MERHRGTRLPLRLCQGVNRRQAGLDAQMSAPAVPLPGSGAVWQAGRQADPGLPGSIRGPTHRHCRGDPISRTHGGAALPRSPRCWDTLSPVTLGLCSLLCCLECNGQANEHPPHRGLGQGQHGPPALSMQQSLPHTEPTPSSLSLQPAMDPSAARLGDSQRSVAPFRAGPGATGSHPPHPEQMPELRPPQG